MGLLHVNFDGSHGAEVCSLETVVSYPTVYYIVHVLHRIVNFFQNLGDRIF